MNLKFLSNDELLLGTKKVVAQEREILVEVLHHLKEIDGRQLYLKIGYSSLWAYCTEELGYAESSAQRRIEAMRAIRDLPKLEEKIESGVLSLSNIAKAQSTLRRHRQSAVALAKNNEKAQYLGENEKLRIFAQLENKSQIEAEAILACEFPEIAKVNERIRKINSEETEIRYVASNRLIDKFEKIKSFFSHQNPNPTQAELEEMMADLVIAHKDPTAKAQRQTKMPRENAKACDKSKLAEDKPTKETNLPPLERQPFPPHGREKNRYIPVRTRSQVWRDAECRCEFLDPKTQRRCNSRHKLEIDHAYPVAFGGSHARENLRLYCRAHNVLDAREATLMG